MATVANRATICGGPIKVECLNLTSVSDADTFTTLIQHPVWALGVNNTDTETTSAALSLSISEKTITINNANLTGDSVVNVLVFGF